MAKFCGKCGTRLDETTGLCPKCHAGRVPAAGKKPPKVRFRWIYLLIPCLTVLLLLGFIKVLPSSKNSPPQEPATEPQTSTFTTQKTPVPPAPSQLMSDYQTEGGGSGAAPTYTAFGSSIAKELVRSIRFLDTLSGAPAQAWDVSQAGDGSVLAWAVSGDSGLYDLYIAGEGGVRAPADCSYLFAEYRFLQTLEFNGAFYVENCRTMRGMFFHDQYLTGLDLSGWDTASVTDMSEMFSFCTSLKELDVSGFDTGSVTDMHSMFSRCETLKSLDLRSFDTSSVTDLNSMFFQSWQLEQLDVSSFDTARVTDMSFLFYSCALKELDLRSFDTRSVQNITGFLDGGTSPMTLKISEKFSPALLREAAGNNDRFLAEGGTINGRPWKTFLAEA